jgi:hypothetical protein
MHRPKSAFTTETLGCPTVCHSNHWNQRWSTTNCSLCLSLSQSQFYSLRRICARFDAQQVATSELPFLAFVQDSIVGLAYSFSFSSLHRCQKPHQFFLAQDSGFTNRKSYADVHYARSQLRKACVKMSLVCLDYWRAIIPAAGVLKHQQVLRLPTVNSKGTGFRLRRSNAFADLGKWSLSYQQSFDNIKSRYETYISMLESFSREPQRAGFNVFIHHATVVFGIFRIIQAYVPILLACKVWMETKRTPSRVHPRALVQWKWLYCFVPGTLRTPSTHKHTGWACCWCI